MFPTVISALALIVSLITAWLTFFRRGSLHMTQPTVIFFGPDGGRLPGRKPKLKVFLRTLLFSTSRRGQTVESLYVNLQRRESKQNFSIWVYGDEKLARGSGLHVGFEGVACNHHFLLPDDETQFPLLPGDYILRVFAKRVCDRVPQQLSQITLYLPEADAQQLLQEGTGIYFDWGPDQQNTTRTSTGAHLSLGSLICLGRTGRVRGAAAWGRV
jgi:hypothetical protein